MWGGDWPICNSVGLCLSGVWLHITLPRSESWHEAPFLEWKIHLNLSRQYLTARRHKQPRRLTLQTLTVACLVSGAFVQCVEDVFVSCLCAFWSWVKWPQDNKTFFFSFSFFHQNKTLWIFMDVFQLCKSPLKSHCTPALDTYHCKQKKTASNLQNNLWDLYLGKKDNISIYFFCWGFMGQKELERTW